MKNYVVKSTYNLTATEGKERSTRMVIRCRDMQEAEDLFLKHFNDKLGLTETDFGTIFIMEEGNEI